MTQLSTRVSRPAARSVGLAGALVALVSVRAWYLRWGATGAEADMVLPGDALMPRANLVATRAVTAHAHADAVWPWIAQMGQGRGGFYSCDSLENLLGCDIHSANRVLPEYQGIAVGDEVRLAPQVGLRVVSLDPGRSLVLRGGIAVGGSEPPYDFTWAFHLRDAPCGATRLLVRERYTYLRPWAAFLVEPTELISFFMSWRMLCGIRARVEHAAARQMRVDASRHSLEGLSHPLPV